MDIRSEPRKKKRSAGAQTQENLLVQRQFQKKKEEVSLDPTRYGDWERKGRAIDF